MFYYDVSIPIFLDIHFSSTVTSSNNFVIFGCKISVIYSKILKKWSTSMWA